MGKKMPYGTLCTTLWSTLSPVLLFSLVIEYLTEVTETDSGQTDGHTDTYNSGKGKITGKVVPVCVHYAMKMYGGSGCISPHILDLSTRWE
jgi:hypothetical protein